MSLKELSPAENRIAKQVALGFSEKEIADRLCISPITVHNHTYNIRKKIKARSAVDICRMFLLSLDDPKKLAICFVFLGIQMGVIFFNPPLDLRKPSRISVKTARGNRSGRRKEFQYA